ncbi:MAG TPA: hypothetical protein VL171_13920, partial [Verrucomicrobiae bacterium]|nr:hypothetical protein [Verrucomicrobiae bacterium]
FLTTWGNLSWRGNGTISIATRTGNTALPDSTWSAWSEAVKSSPAKVTSPRGRFIQLRTQLAGSPEPVLQSLSVFYRMQNQKPEIQSVEVGERQKESPTVKSKTDVSAEGKSDADVELAVTAAIEGVTPAAKPEEATAKPASPIKQIRWTASDKDGDTLVYRIYYQADGDESWIPAFLEKPLKKTEYSWNTESIPDGWYRIKVVASDEESNPPGDALTDEKISDPVKVDNTRPQVLQLSCDAATGVLKGVARDNLSLIRSLEYSIDGGEWKFFAPKDGVFDDREEAFEIKVGPLAAGPHFVAVRATDDEGNIGVQKVSVHAR